MRTVCGSLRTGNSDIEGLETSIYLCVRTVCSCIKAGKGQMNSGVHSDVVLEHYD